MAVHKRSTKSSKVLSLKHKKSSSRKVTHNHNLKNLSIKDENQFKVIIACLFMKYLDFSCTDIISLMSSHNFYVANYLPYISCLDVPSILEFSHPSRSITSRNHVVVEKLPNGARDSSFNICYVDRCHRLCAD